MGEDFPAQLAWFRQGSVLAGYRLEAQVGAGGMAVVFRARDQRLDRSVALKILAPALASDGAFRRRFIAESRAAARVDDPHIIPVYEAGEAEGVLFIAMKFVMGGDLRRVLEQEGALPPDRAAEFISPVASALDAAHGAGLVHRDVKPANVLVDARPGRPDHVYLSDFGASKGAASSVSLTGHFLGTPDYSAPEQVQGRVVDGRTDQYALGCVAYQLLTGSVPYERDQGMAVLLAHLSEPPPSLSSRRADLPAAADRVLAQALAKAPEDRYGSCGEFADALRAALGLGPYHPRRPGATPDHPLTVITPQPGFPETITAGDGKAAVPADLEAPATIDSVPGADSPHAVDPPAAAAIVTAPAGRAAATMPSVPRVRTPDQGGPSIPQPGGGVPPTRRPGRILAIALATAVVIAAAVVIPLLTVFHTPYTFAFSDPGHASVTSVAFSPSGTTLAAAGGHGSTYLWNTATRNRTATLTDPNGTGVAAVAFSPNGATLATADGNGSTYLWNTATSQQTIALTDPNGVGVTAVAFSPDGTTLAIADSGGGTYLWNTATGNRSATLTDPSSKGIAAVAFSPNGTTLATADGNGSTYLWNTATGNRTATLTDPNGTGVAAVAFSPSGTTLAAAGGNGSTYLWNTITGNRTIALADPNGVGVTAVAFSPSGTTLATADGNGSTYLWNTATGNRTTALTDPSSKGVTAVAFSPTGTTLATADRNGNTYLWNSA